MTIENINIEQTIESVQKELKGDKYLQAGLVNSINLLVFIIKLLISRLGLNSSNSSLPPSSNNPRRTRGADKKKRKKKSALSVGGQVGHDGATLEQYEDVDKVIELPIDRRTLPSGEKFTRGEDEIRQVLEIEMRLIVREYRAEVLIAAMGHVLWPSFPRMLARRFNMAQV